MAREWLLFYMVSLLAVSTAVTDASNELTQFVNPFIGTEGQGYPGTAINSGNVFPGAALPFGVVKFGIDTTAFDWTNVDADAGYTPDGYGTMYSSLPGFQANAGSHWSEYAAREWNRGKSSLLHRIF